MESDQIEHAIDYKTRYINSTVMNYKNKKQVSSGFCIDYDARIVVKKGSKNRTVSFEARDTLLCSFWQAVW